MCFLLKKLILKYLTVFIKLSISIIKYIPRGPNFLLSKTIAWKKESPNNNFFHSWGLLDSSNRLASYPK